MGLNYSSSRLKIKVAASPLYDGIAAALLHGDSGILCILMRNSPQLSCTIPSGSIDSGLPRILVVTIPHI
jgi:hypothetical protein